VEDRNLGLPQGTRHRERLESRNRPSNPLPHVRLRVEQPENLVSWVVVIGDRSVGRNRKSTGMALPSGPGASAPEGTFWSDCQRII